MALSDRVQAILDKNSKTPQELDAEHADWLAQGGLFEALQNFPQLAIPPSQRSTADRRDILIYNIKHYGKGAWRLAPDE